MAYSKVKLDGFTWITGSPTDLNPLQINKLTTKYVIVVEDTILDIQNFDVDFVRDSVYTTFSYGLNSSLIIQAGNPKDLDGKYFLANIFGGVDTYFWVATGIEGEKKIKGTDGHDYIEGSKNKDKIKSKDGLDVIFADKGKDKLVGGNGQDNIYGGKDKDKIKGGSGADRLDGEEGNDKINGNSGNDGLYGGSGDDKLYGDSGNDQLFGDSGNDRLYGSTGIDLLNGGSGNDTLNGGSGNDELIGGSGNDFLEGASGFDKLTGGAGDDYFYFRFASDSSAAVFGPDEITDFSKGEDIIYLSAIDAISITFADDAFNFIGTSGFSNTAGELRYFRSGNDTFVLGDTNGNGTADFSVQLKDFTGSLTADDFIL